MFESHIYLASGSPWAYAAGLLEMRWRRFVLLDLAAAAGTLLHHVRPRRQLV